MPTNIRVMGLILMDQSMISKQLLYFGLISNGILVGGKWDLTHFGDRDTTGKWFMSVEISFNKYNIYYGPKCEKNAEHCIDNVLRFLPS